MRILYLMTEPFGVGGVQSDVLTLSRELTHNGHEVHVATTPGVLLDELLSGGAIFHNLNFHVLGIVDLFRAAFSLRKLIGDLKLDLLAPQSVRTTIICWIAVRLIPFYYRVARTLRRIPVVTTIHNIHNPIHFKYGGHILRLCSDYVIFESHYERNRLIASDLPERMSEVIHSGIDTDKFKPLDRNARLAEQYGLAASSQMIFGIVARLSEEKGHQYLLAAFSVVLKQLPNAKLMIVGDGPLLDEVKTQANALDLTGSVIFTAMQRNIPEFLSLFDVFVLSSTRESFPLAAREAMAAGKAVIAPRIGGCPEVVSDGETGFLFESANSADLARAMLTISEQDRYKTFGINARRRVESLFSQHQWVTGDERVYKKWYL